MSSVLFDIAGIEHYFTTVFLKDIDAIANHLMGLPAIALLLGTGLYLTLKLNFIQLRAYPRAWRVIFQSGKTQVAGELTGLQALATVLSGTIGTGNIAGVATAITMGGPGAVFWMWITAICGMATKFASCTLAHHFREVSAEGEVRGGPMYTIKHGLKSPKMGGLFAFFLIFSSLGTGALVQGNSVADGVSYVVPMLQGQNFLIGGILALSAAVVLIGGIQRIGHMAVVMVPFMALAYIAGALLILALHWERIPEAFGLIISDAFHSTAVGGGLIGAAMQYGIARGLFASEAGLGTAPVGLALANTKRSTDAGLIGMLGPSIDTLMVCTMTALVIIIVTGIGVHHLPAGLNGASLSAYAFEHGLMRLGPIFAQLGALIVGVGLVFFAYTTIVAWAYYGEVAVHYLLGTWWAAQFRYVYIAAVMIGAIAPLVVVWRLTDIANISMAIPNIVSLVLLGGLVKKLVQKDTQLSDGQYDDDSSQVLREGAGS